MSKQPFPLKKGKNHTLRHDSSDGRGEKQVSKDLGLEDSLLIFAAVPKRDPYIEGNKHKYSPGELVELNCTSNASDPEADLFWYIDALPVRFSRGSHRYDKKELMQMEKKVPCRDTTPGAPGYEISIYRQGRHV